MKLIFFRDSLVISVVKEWEIHLRLKMWLGMKFIFYFYIFLLLYKSVNFLFNFFRALSQKLHELKNCIQSAVVNRVVEDFIDVVTPLKQFTEAVMAPEGTPHREQNFAEKALNLEQFSNRAAKTARMVAAGGSGGNKKLTEALLNSANQVIESY